jgi:large subunit ribosomal protein L23
MEYANIIIKPLLTEKSTRLQVSKNTYAFEVSSDANKCQIKEAVEKLYSVKVADVRTMVRKGKPRRSRYRVTKTPTWKRALVTLQGEAKIQLF